MAKASGICGVDSDYSRHVSGGGEIPPPPEILLNMVRRNLGPQLKNCRLLAITKRRITLEKVSYSLIYCRIDECELCIAHWYGM